MPKLYPRMPIVISFPKCRSYLSTAGVLGGWLQVPRLYSQKFRRTNSNLVFFFFFSFSWRWHKVKPSFVLQVSATKNESWMSLGVRTCYNKRQSYSLGGLAMPLCSIWSCLIWEMPHKKTTTKIGIRSCRLNFRFRNKILLKSHLQTNSKHS